MCRCVKMADVQCCCCVVQSKKMECFSSVDAKTVTTLDCELCQRLTVSTPKDSSLLPDIVLSCALKRKITPASCGRHLRHLAQDFEVHRRKLQMRPEHCQKRRQFLTKTLLILIVLGTRHVLLT